MQTTLATPPCLLSPAALTVTVRDWRTSATIDSPRQAAGTGTAQRMLWEELIGCIVTERICMVIAIGFSVNLPREN